MATIPPDQTYRSSLRRDDDMPSSALPDPAFEPNANYLFEDLGDQDDFHTMQCDIATLNVLHGAHSQHGLHGHPGARTRDSNTVNGHDHPNPDFVDPYMFEQGQHLPISPPWSSLAGHTDPRSCSMQSSIVNSRSESLSQPVSNITPPDDDMSDGHQPGEKEQGPTSSEQMAMNAKSERARNAANHRHAKAKKARRESIRKTAGNSDDDDDEVEVDDKRERYREKNRLAAAKCRAKKKVNTEDLEQSAREASSLNNQLRAEERELRDLFSSLRNQALAHDPTQGCGCQDIHSYNMHKAQQAARGVTLSLASHAMPSPPQQSLDSTSPSTVGTSSRAQSFSGGQLPFTAEHTNRSHLVADPSSFGASATGDSVSKNDPADPLTSGGHESFCDFLSNFSEGQPTEYS